MDSKNLPGSLKVAILLQAIGEDISHAVFTNLDDAERKMIQSQLFQIGDISPDLVEKIAQEFTEMAKRRNKSASTTGQKQNQKGDSDGSISGLSNLKSLQSIEPDRLTELIKEEHPQTIAIILVHLKTEVASEVLDTLPDEIKPDVALRIAMLDKVTTGMVKEIDSFFESVLTAKDSSVIRQLGGASLVAEILNQLDGSSGELILNDIEEVNPELAAEIKQRMFVFEDLILIDDRGLQKLLRNIETKELSTALKAASEEVKDKIFRNMSERAGDMLKEEIEAMGAVRMKEVEDAQQTITRLIQDMEAKGDIIISGRKGEEFIA